jgi:hypothetical protein
MGPAGPVGVGTDVQLYRAHVTIAVPCGSLPFCVTFNTIQKTAAIPTNPQELSAWLTYTFGGSPQAPQEMLVATGCVRQDANTVAPVIGAGWNGSEILLYSIEGAGAIKTQQFSINALPGCESVRGSVAAL